MNQTPQSIGLNVFLFRNQLSHIGSDIPMCINAGSFKHRDCIINLVLLTEVSCQSSINFRTLWLNRLLNRSCITVQQMPCQVYDARHQGVITVCGSAQFSESFGLPGPHENISKLPVWLSVIRRQLNSLPCRRDRAGGVTRYLVCAGQRQPQNIVVRSQCGRFCVFGNSCGLIIVCLQQSSTCQTHFRVVTVQLNCRIGRSHLIVCQGVAAENVGHSCGARYPNRQQRYEHKCHYAGITSQQ